VLELCQVNDIRAGGVPKVLKQFSKVKILRFISNWKDPRLLYELQSRAKGNLEDVSLTICSGYDMVNINYTHVVCPNEETAKVIDEKYFRFKIILEFNYSLFLS
jgi:phosphatidylinositol phospholipase C beta